MIRGGEHFCDFCGIHEQQTKWILSNDDKEVGICDQCIAAAQEAIRKIAATENKPSHMQ